MSFLQKILSANDRYSPAQTATESDLYTNGYTAVVIYLGYEDLPGLKPGSAFQQAKPIVERLFGSKTEKKKYVRVQVTVTATGFLLSKAGTREKLANIKLFRISHIGMHGDHPTAFWMIEKAQNSSRISCHVLQCKSPQAAAALTAVTGKAFQNSFKAWDRNRKKTTSNESSAPQTDVSAAGGGSDDSEEKGSISDLLGFMESEKEREDREEDVFARRASRTTRPDLIVDVTQSAVAGEAMNLSFADFLKFVNSVEGFDD